jgi:hypothetical protein
VNVVATRNEVGRGGRVVAACLAAIWLAGGFIGLLIGVWLRRGALPILLGLLALGYGWLWVRVALTGHRQQWTLGRRSRERHLR